MEHQNYLVTLTTTAITAVTAIGATIITQVLISRREHRTRHLEDQARRVLRVKDLQRQTLVELQDEMCKMIDVVMAIVAHGVVIRSWKGASGRSTIEDLELEDVLKPNVDFISRQARVLTLLSRVDDSEVKRLSLDLCGVAKNSKSSCLDGDDIQALLDPLLKPHLAVNRRIGEVIRLLDQAN